MMQKLTIVPNVPQQIALKYREGKVVEGRFGDQTYYTLATPANTCVYLDMDPAAKVNALAARPNEPFWICKWWNGKKSETPQWEVWPVEESESVPAQATGIPDTELEQQLRASVAQAQRRNSAGANASTSAPVAAPITQPQRMAPTNGTKPAAVNGNGANARPYEAAGIPAPPTKIPYDVAFREILAIVVDGLKAVGEQWSDSAKQDAVSTLLIQASRDGFLTCWNRGAK
jgi:hypothetical protein